MRHTNFRVQAAVLAAAFAIAPVGAQSSGFPQASDQPDEGYSPDHAVARISLINGEVSVAHENNDMVAAAPNAPMVTGDRILTGDNSRAEVQFDGVNFLRIAPGTEVRMGDLQDRHYLVQVAQGMILFRILQDAPAENAAQVEISTPSVSMRPTRAGIYRVLVRDDGTSELTVRSGDSEIFAPTGSEPLGAGQSIVSRGPASDPEFQDVQSPPFDDFDRWSADRDRVFERSNESSQYVSPDVYGTEQLDAYGRWSYDPEYGNVWIPTVAADWAPYRLGRWSWVDYYGWSWISYDPWGWAPYHYGRWYRGSYGWAWYPGAVGPRYYWRPALVSFFGWGSPGFGASFSFGFGNVGWVPLAPREAYRPWYGRWGGGRGFTVVNNTNIVNVYRNGRYPGGITSMRAGDFGRRGIQRNSGFVRANGGDLARAGVLNGSPFGPSRQGRQFVSRDVNTRGMPRTGDNMRFFSSPRQSGGFGQPAAAGGNRGGFRRLDGAAPNSNAGGIASPRQNSGFRSFGGATPRNDNGGGFTSPRSEGFRGFNQPAPRADNPAQGGFRRFGANEGVTPRNNPPQGNAPGFNGGNRDRGNSYAQPPQQQQMDRGQRGGSGGGSFGRPREQQPVRIAPPIVNNRGDRRNEYRSAPPTQSNPGFGASRPNFGGGGFNGPRGGNAGGGGGFSGPRGGNGGGGFRGPSGGGGSRGGGGGSRGGGRRR